MRNYNILLVDDDPMVLKSLRRALAEEKYTIFTAPNAIDGLEVMKRHKIHLVISDERMPGIHGNEFLKMVRERFPSTIRVMLTGQASLESAIKAINEGEIFRFLTKPWNSIELIITIQQALERYDLEAKNRYLLMKVNQQAATIRMLEEQCPGISKVKTDSEGAIIAPDPFDLTDEDLDEIIAQCEQEAEALCKQEEEDLIE
ncbi:MAG: response regulator [bacterium]|nr:response regulator [bacterium]